MASDASVIGKSFDKAIEGIKVDDLSATQNLGVLLMSMATASDDGTLMLSGFSITQCATGIAMLQSLRTVNPSGLKELLQQASKDLRAALQELKPQLTGADPEDPKAVLSTLGQVARTTFRLNQKMMELRQFSPLGGGGDGNE